MCQRHFDVISLKICYDGCGVAACVHACSHTRTCTHSLNHEHTHTNAYTHAHTRTYTHVFLSTRVYAYHLTGTQAGEIFEQMSVLCSLPQYAPHRYPMYSLLSLCFPVASFSCSLCPSNIFISIVPHIFLSFFPPVAFAIAVAVAISDTFNCIHSHTHTRSDPHP